jgi:hypothetical protein
MERKCIEKEVYKINVQCTQISNKETELVAMFYIGMTLKFVRLSIEKKMTCKINIATKRTDLKSHSL